MPDRLTAQQEKFCRKLVEGMSQSDAALAAGYGPGFGHNITATRLMKQDKIKARLEKLRAEAAYVSNVTIASIAEELDKAWKLAFVNKRPEACIAASIAKAKLFGMMVDPKPTNNILDLTIINKPLPFPSKQIEMSVDEWVEKWSPREIGHSNGHGEKT